MFKVELAPRARHELRRVPDSIYPRIRAKLLVLTTTPRPPGCIKLTDSVDRYRVRVGDWRILYSVDDDKRLVIVHRIAPRESAYD